MIESGLTLQTALHERYDFDRGIVRMDPTDIKRLGLASGARVAIVANRTIYGIVQPIAMEYRNQGLICLDDLQLQNCGARTGDKVQITTAPPMDVIEKLTLIAPNLLDARAGIARMTLIKRYLDGIAAGFGDMLRVRMPDQYDLLLYVESTPGNTPGLIKNLTDIKIATKPSAPSIMDRLGGFRREFMQLEERLTQLRNREPNAVRGIILQGPPGCGKNMLIEAVAESSKAYFDRINAARLIADATSARLALQQSFATAASQAPAVILIDDIDLLLMATEDWQRVTLANQLYEQIDLLPRQTPVLIFGVMHHDVPLDPSAKRPGRFERQMTIAPPDRENRLEILQILSQNSSLTYDADFEHLASLTRGYVGADLAALLQDGALKAQRSENLRTRAAATAPQSMTVNMNHLRAALTEIVPSGRDSFMTETPELCWQDIAGLDEIKQTLREAVERPINQGGQYGMKGAQPPHGVLITGAPGTGKTSMVRALASATYARFVHVKCADIALAETPQLVLRQIFVKARQAAPCILFFDDIECIIPAHDTVNTAKNSIIFNSFLHELDSTNELLGLTIFGATSHVDRIDQTLMRPGRFDYVVNIPMPDNATRQKIFMLHAYKLPLAADVNFDTLADTTQGFSGADIEGICRRAGLIAIRQSLSLNDPQNPPVVNMAIFEQILRGWRR
ncbi:MAG: AAA family ATPase [Alphaproteobacteria bacterium]